MYFLVFQMPEAVSKVKEECQLGTFQNCENTYYYDFIIKRSELLPLSAEKILRKVANK